MIIVQVKEGENIERALKKFKRKFEKTGVVKELRSRQAFEKPSVTNRKKMMKAVYVQQLRRNGGSCCAGPRICGTETSVSMILRC